MTKKSPASPVMQSVDDDEGYGTSPTNSASPRPDGNVFNFVEPPTVSSKNVVLEDDWSSLEKDLNRVLNLNQPLAQSAVKKTVPSSLSPARMSFRNVASPAGKTSRGTISCQFCAKNGELRSVVRVFISQKPWVQIINVLYYLVRWSLTYYAIQSLAPSFVQCCASTFAKCVEQQATMLTPSFTVSCGVFWYRAMFLMKTFCILQVLRIVAKRRKRLWQSCWKQHAITRRARGLTHNFPRQKNFIVRHRNHVVFRWGFYDCLYSHEI